MTWADLIADVRAQIGVTPDQAYAWLLDRARVMNAEAGWLVNEKTYTLTPDLVDPPWLVPGVTLLSVLVNNRPYHRATVSELDIARRHGSPRPIYAPAVVPWEPGLVTALDGLAVWPDPQVGDTVTLRYVDDVMDNRAGSPPFPVDFHSALADGAIAIGLARSDERFDSAGYFDARFSDAIQRLKLRRHSRVGRGGVPIRTVR